MHANTVFIGLLDAAIVVQEGRILARVIPRRFDTVVRGFDHALLRMLRNNEVMLCHCPPRNNPPVLSCLAAVCPCCLQGFWSLG